MTASKLVLVLSLIICTLTGASPGFAYGPSTGLLAGPLPKKVVAFKLEKVELKGSDRIDSELLSEVLNLNPGIDLDDSFVMNTREKLLSLGLFRSVILSMRKGSQRGKAILIVRLEDDPTVLGPWAIGGNVKIAQGQTKTSDINPDTPPLGYKLQLISRNLFSSLYRGAISGDIDSIGEIRAARLSIGLPRFAKEDLQFDFDVSAVDARYRYLEALGFGGKIYGNWTQSIGDYSGLEYGVAMYVNREPNFEVPGFPRSLAGPRIAWHYESRLQRFFPDGGSKASFGFLYAPIEKKHSVSEVSLAHTISFADKAWITFNADTYALGADGYAARAEAKLDLALTNISSEADQAGMYLALRGGKDKFENTNLEGSAAVVGLRYHSAGFIAEISFQITRVPDELKQEELKDWGGFE
jgi:hypothetical protein